MEGSGERRQPEQRFVFPDAGRGAAPYRADIVSRYAQIGSGVMRASRWLAIAILIAGGTLTCRAAYQQAKGKLASVLIRRAWDSERTPENCKHRGPARTCDRLPAADTAAGYDKLCWKERLSERWRLSSAHANGAGFGERGNLLLAGHRDSWFLPLQEMEPGEAIVVAWYDSRTKSVNEKNTE